MPVRILHSSSHDPIATHRPVRPGDVGFTRKMDFVCVGCVLCVWPLEMTGGMAVKTSLRHR